MVDVYPTPQSKRARDVLESRVRQGSAKGTNARYLVQDILQFNLPIAARYKHLDVIRILQDNCSSSGPGLDALIHALSMLERYGKNLVRSERPPQWRVVRLSNSIFKKEVDILKGARDILRLLGYTKKVEDGLAYVDECVVPDVPAVASVTADILLLRQELTMLTKGEHKQQRDFLSYIPYEELSRIQGFYAQQQMQKSTPSETPAPEPQLPLESQSYPAKLPPSYEQALNGVGPNPLHTVGQSTQQLFHPSSGGLLMPSSTVQNQMPVAAPVVQAAEVSEDELCHICGQIKSTVMCQKCDQQYCAPCDQIWHNNPRRKCHKRVSIPLQNGINFGSEFNERSLLNNHQEYLPSNSSLPQQSSSGGYYNISGLAETRQPGEEGNQGSQPTVSGARLPPNPNSRSTSINDNENEWTRKVNRMATELMDIADPDAQKSKLFSCLDDINKEKDKYIGGIQQLQSKGFEKPSLVAHFEERLGMLANLEEQLKALVSYTEPPAETAQSVSSLAQNEDNPEESWSFKSVKSGPEFNSNLVASSMMNLGTGDFQPYAQKETVPLTTAVHLNGSTLKPNQPLQEADPPITIANLIDFSTPPEAVSVPSVTSTSISYTQDLVGLDLQKTKPSKAMSSLEDLDDITTAKKPLGEVENTSNFENFTSPFSSMHEAGSYSCPTSPQSTSVSLRSPNNMPSTSLKRLNSNQQMGENRPTKVYRANPSSLSNVSEVNSEITNRLENMNIETRNAETIPMVVGQQSNFSTFFEDASPYLQNRIEEEPLSLSKSILQTLSHEDLQKRIRKEENLLQTTQFIDWIRMGQSERYLPEHVQIAVAELDNEGNLARILPNAWLRKKWSGNLSTFRQYVKENCGFVITMTRAEECLLAENNNFPEALELIKEDINEQLHYNSGIYGKEAAQNALIKCGGDEYRSTAILQKDEIKSFYLEVENGDLEDENEDDEEHLRNISQIKDEELRTHAHIAALDVSRCVYMDTYNALTQVLPLDMRNMVGDVIEAVLSYPGDVENAIRYLDNECMICLDKFPRSKITCLPTCGDNECMYCVSCLERHLSICITDKNIRDIICPVCSNPEYNSDEETITNFFNHIDAILRQMKDKRINELFQQKLRDLTLMRMPNFRWCSHCSGGFQFEIEIENNLKMICPFCQKGTCYSCKKQWEPQHEGISCEQFQLWKESNDPEFQAAGLARHLKENGIDCPDCNFRYALAKGGCMHFKCTQCSHEFCSGCKSPFKHGRACNIFPSCISKGLHAHHPRDCLFYLRDSDPEMFQKLLDKYNVQYNSEGPNQGKCQVVEQKETSTGMKDDFCGRELKRGQAGLCKLHYNEYLVNLVIVNGLDPAEVFSIDQLKPCLMREDKPIPKRLDNETDENYAKRLLKEVKKLPLIKRQRRN